MAHATRRLGTWCLALAALAACSGDDGALPSEPPVEPRETTTTDATATSLAPETSDAVSTSAPTTAAPSSPPPSAVPTALPASTNPASPEAEVLKAVESFYSSWRECLRALPGCDVNAIQAPLAPSYAEQLAVELERLNSSFYEAENVESFVARLLSIDPGETRYLVTVCQTNDTVIYRRPPGEPEELVSEGQEAKIREWTVDLHDGVWSIAGSRTIEAASSPEEDLCH